MIVSDMNEPREHPAGGTGAGNSRFCLQFEERRFMSATPHKSDDKNHDLGPPAVHGLSSGFPASAGRVSLRLDFRFRAGVSGMLRP